MPKLIGSPTSTTYRYPALCARCGSPDANYSGQVVKSTNSRFFRFVWEKAETFTLTVPVCAACKTLLDKHTWRAGLMSIVGYLVGAGAVLLLTYTWAEWFFLLIAAWWGGALTSRLLTGLYRRLFHRPQGITWPELCTYTDGMLTFKRPEFQRQFLQLNIE